MNQHADEECPNCDSGAIKWPDGYITPCEMCDGTGNPKPIAKALPVIPYYPPIH